MADKKTFTVGFDVADRFTSKYDEILKRINKLTDVVHKIELQLDTGSVSKIEASTARVTRAVQKSTTEFGSQKRALDQASAGFRSLADSMDRASGSQSRLGGLLGSLKGRFGELMNVADDFSDMTRSLAQGDLLGAGRAGSSLVSGGGRALAAGLGVSTGALLAGGAVAGAAVLSLPEAATWEKQVGRASKTALGEGSSKTDLATDMLLAYQDLKGVDQESFVAAVGGAGSLGYQDEEAVQAAVMGSKAGAAFDIETSEAMRMLGVVNQMWAEQAEEIGGNIVMMEKAGSAVNVLGNKYSASEANVLEFLSQAGGLAKVWKMDVAETAAIGAVLETVNIKASEGETMFRSALNAGIFQKRALAPDQEKAFRKAGINPKGEMGYDIAGAMLGVSGQEYQKKLNENMADTMFATVDAILEKSGGNDALAQQMAEAVFGSYGMGFLKLGGQRENLATMTKEAKTGFDAGTSLEEEYGKQTSNIIDTFGQTKKIFSSLAKVIALLLLPPLALLLGLFNGLVGPVVKLAVFLEGMLFKQIEKIVGKFQGTQLGQDLAKAFSAITDTAGKIWEVIGPILVKLLELVLDVLSGPIMGVLWLIAAIYDKIRPYVLKIVDVLLLVVDKLKGMWNWLMDAIPGARKEEARKALEAQAKKEGLGITAAGSIVKLDRFGMPDPRSGAEGDASDKLLGLKKKYDSLPGFAEGIADAVKRGLDGFAETIAEKIGEYMPDFSSLTAAIEGLLDWLNGLGGGSTRPDEEPTGVSPSGKTSYPNPDYPGTWDLYDENGRLYASAVSEERKATYLSADVGGRITSSGGLIGHEGEEIVPADIVRGPGIIARAMRALGTAEANGGSYAVGRVAEVHIHNDNRFDFAGAKIDSTFDIAGFMREVDKRIEAGSKKAVERAIGQGRT